MKKAKNRFRFRKRISFHKGSNLVEAALVFPDGDDDEDLRLYPNPNREEVRSASKKNQFK